MFLTEEATNQNFKTAYRYVETNYAYLFHESLAQVAFVRTLHVPGVGKLHRAGGLHARIGGQDGFSVISVRDAAEYDAKTYVEILVHELTHLRQWTSGRAMTLTEAECEAEAYPVGVNAANLFEYQDLQAALRGA